jgi:perosamine synthetase
VIPHNENPLGQVGQGPEVEKLEHELAERFRPTGACAVVSSGTAALYVALYCLSWRRSLKIPTYACTSLFNAAKTSFNDVRLGDVWEENFNVPHTINEAGILQQTYGVPSLVSGSWIEDFTHSPGASIYGKPCGSMGVASIISFGATKPLGVGQGGAVLGAPGLIEAIKLYRDYDGRLDAFNFQLSDVMAFMVRDRLKCLDRDNAWRKATAERYAESLCDAIQYQHMHIPEDAGSFRTWYRFVLRFKKPESVILSQAYLRGCGIETIVPLRTDELLHRKLGLDPSLFPNAEEIAKTTLSIPIFPGMSEESVAKVCEGLKALERYV